MTTTPALIPAAGLQFVNFAMERCIRVVTGNGEQCLPVDARQREELLEPIAMNACLNSSDHARLTLIKTEVAGVTYAALDTVEGELYGLAQNADSGDCSSFDSSCYGGVVWRVLGYLSDSPDNALELSSGNDEEGVRAILGAFQTLLTAGQRSATAPARIVMDLTDGTLQGVYSHQAVEIITVSFDDEADVSQEALAVKQCAGLPAAIWQHRDGGEPEMELFFAEAAKRFTLTA